MRAWSDVPRSDSDPFPGAKLVLRVPLTSFLPIITRAQVSHPTITSIPPYYLRIPPFATDLTNFIGSLRNGAYEPLAQYLFEGNVNNPPQYIIRNTYVSIDLTYGRWV